jgi:hypothetical protein
MHLLIILIQEIYRGRRFGGVGVETASPNRGCSAGVPQTEVSMPLPVSIWKLQVEMLSIIQLIQGGPIYHPFTLFVFFMVMELSRPSPTYAPSSHQHTCMARGTVAELAHKDWVQVNPMNMC